MLTGSQARAGMATERSDYDVLVVVADGQVAHFASESRHDSELDVTVPPLSEFRPHALPAGSEFAWARYSFTHSQVVIDTDDGLIEALVREKGTLSQQEAAIPAPRLLDQFINLIHRSRKNQRDGRELAARMDAAEPIRPMIGYVCALDRRVEPYTYLEWELERFPLPIPGWGLDATRTSIAALLRPADLLSAPGRRTQRSRPPLSATATATS